MTETLSPPFRPTSAHEAVGLTVHCLRAAAIFPDAQSRGILHKALQSAKEAVAPSEVFPAWCLHVTMACVFTLLAEGQLQAALRALDEFESIDGSLGLGVCAQPDFAARLAMLRQNAVNNTPSDEQTKPL